MNKFDKGLNLYFKLTRKQKRRFSELGCCHVLIENTPMSKWKQVTKSKELINEMIELKRMYIREVAA